MQTLHQWIWQEPEWPRMRWDQGVLAPLLARARLAQGKALGATRLLDAGLTLEAAAAILVEDGITTSAIEGERLDLDAVRSSVARHLGLPTAGLPAPPRAVDGLIDVLLDATGGYDKPLTTRRLFGWHAALFPYGRSGLHTIRSGALRGDDPMQVVSGGAGRERIHLLAPPREGLEAELDNFLAWFDAAPAGFDGLVRAGVAHLWFVTLHPFEDGNGRTHAVAALQGLAPYWFEVDVSAYLSNRGELTGSAEAEYELLLTQRLILQPRAELAWSAEDMPSLETGAGLTSIEAGVRLRYEIVRQFAPYVGIEWTRQLGETADYTRAAGGDPESTAIVAGLRIWF